MTSKTGIGFYDDAKSFEAYWRDRANRESENDTLERPLMLEMLGDVRGKRILDLGCGAGELGHILLERGAASYVGLDGSQRMVAAAKPAPNLTVAVADIAHDDLPDATFDLVVSSLVMHYIPELAPLFTRVARYRAPFVFSAEHPIITSHYPDEGEAATWTVDTYFERGVRHQHWKGDVVVKYHRTLEDYFRDFRSSGLTVSDVRESEPRRENFVHEATYTKRLAYPLFLFFSARPQS